MFHLQNVTLLQPEEVMEPRLSGGSDALSAYLKGVQDVLTSHYATSENTGARSLIIAIGPNARCQFWLVADSLSPEEKEVVQDFSRLVQPPAVHEGPVILALAYSVGAEPIPPQELTMPTEWLAVADSAGGQLSVDDIVLKLWASAG